MYIRLTAWVMSNTQHNGLNRILDARYHQQGDDSAEAMTLARWLVLEFLGSQVFQKLFLLDCCLKSKILMRECWSIELNFD